MDTNLALKANSSDLTSQYVLIRNASSPGAPVIDTSSNISSIYLYIIFYHLIVFYSLNIRQIDTMNFNQKLLNKKTLRNNNLEFEDIGKIILSIRLLAEEQLFS